MGFARVGSNPTVVDHFLFVLALDSRSGPSGAMDSASDFGSGGWGFESPLGLNCFLPMGTFFVQHSKFGRVVKALALGASLERGMGSNPIACMLFF